MAALFPLGMFWILWELAKIAWLVLLAGFVLWMGYDYVWKRFQRKK